MRGQNPMQISYRVEPPFQASVVVQSELCRIWSQPEDRFSRAAAQMIYSYLAASFHLPPEIPNVLPQLKASQPHLKSKLRVREEVKNKGLLNYKQR